MRISAEEPEVSRTKLSGFGWKSLIQRAFDA